MAEMINDKSIPREAEKVDSTQEAGVAPIESDFVNLSKWRATRVFWKPTLVCIMAMFAVLMDGYAQQLPGNIISNAGFIQQFGTVIDPKTGKKSLNPHYVSLWGGLVGTTIFVGQQVGSILADRFGRIPTRIFFTLVMISATLAEIFSVDWKGWLAAKAVVGFGQGLIQACTLSYVAEVAPTQTRGALVSVYGIFIAIGQLVSAIALQIVNTTHPLEYKKGLYSQWALHGLWILCLPFLPESPWWHARGHRAEKCKAILLRLNKHVQGYNVEKEYLSMELEIAHEETRKKEANSSSYREIFTFPNLQRTIAGACGVAMIMWVGAGVVFSYATYFFQQAGIAEPFQCTVIVYSILVFGAIVSTTYLTERFGRRRMVMTGGTGCTICGFIIGGLGTLPKAQSVNNAILAFICGWVACYSFCLSGVSWGLSAELSSPRLRAKTTAFSQNFYQAFGIVFGFTIPLMLGSGPGNAGWGVKTMFLYAILGGIGTIVNFFTLPEVRGRTYNEIDEMFSAGIAPRKMAAYHTLVEQEGTKSHK